MDTERCEHELARQARDGDRKALAELVERVRPRLFALAYGELRHYEDAQDAVAAALETEHLLIGLVHERYGLAARVLARVGLDLEKVRQEVLKIVK